LLITISVVYNPVLWHGDMKELYLPLVCLTIILKSKKSDYEWVSFTYKSILLLSSVHMIMTIVFWLYPNICSNYRDVLATRTDLDVDNLAYKSGLTSQYGINSIFISVCVLAYFCELFCERKRAIIILMFFVSVFSFLLVSKRGGTVAILISIFVVLFIKNKNSITKIWKSIFYLLTALFALYLVSINVPEITKVFYRFYNQEDISNGRYELWSYAIEEFKRSPLFGYGWNSFYYKTNGLAHSLYVQLLYELGIIGAGFALSIFVANIIKLVRFIINSANLSPENSRILLFSFCCQIFFLIQGITTNMLTQHFYLVYLISVFGASSVIYNHSKNAIIKELI
jgi:O-antigen ligase